MDRSLDEIISERPSRGGRGPPRGPRRDPQPPPRAPRREEYPRDGVRKNRRDDRVNLESDWVHDRYEDGRYERQHRRAAPPDIDRYEPAGRAPETGSGTKLRIENVHYELTEADLRDLFERKGPVISVRLLYDRHDRSEGTAFVIYEDYRDAEAAIADYDGQFANGQPIRITVVPSAPTGPPAGRASASLFDRIERPPRSLFDRIDAGRERENSRDGGRWRRDRSDSPRKGRAPPPPDHIDRYVPGRRGSRSPVRRRGTPREPGRRPGQRREDSHRGGRGGGGGGRRGRTDDDGHPLVGGRPRKTAEELDAEMEDYWGGGNGNNEASNGDGPVAHDVPAAPAATDNDEDMVL